MFNMFSTQSGQPNTVSIREANDHLQKMHQRIADLDQRVKEQTELLERRENEHRVNYNRMKNQYDSEIHGFKQQLRVEREENNRLHGVIKEKEVQIAYLLSRCSYLDEAASYAPLLDQLATCLKSAFAAPAPKVQTVKPVRPKEGAAINQNRLQEGQNSQQNGTGHERTHNGLQQQERVNQQVQSDRISKPAGASVKI